MKIENSSTVIRFVPEYESYNANEIAGYRYEFCSWTDEIVKMIDRQLDFMGPASFHQH